MPKQKKGFVFVETIIVTCVLLSTLMVVYSMYVTSINSESRYLRYDDPAKLYETYYLKKYLESFYMDKLIDSIKEDCTPFPQNECQEKSTCSWNSTTSKCEKRRHYELIYQGRSDIFERYYEKEMNMFDSLWNYLHIKNIYLLPNNIMEISQCKLEGYDTICANRNLVTYLKSIDNAPANTYVFIVEYQTSRTGEACSQTSSDCQLFYSYMIVGET